MFLTMVEKDIVDSFSDVNNVVPNELLGMNLLLKQALVNLIS